MNSSFLPKLSDRLACINKHWPTPSFKRIDEYEVQVFRIRLHFALFIIPTKIGNNDLREINYAPPFVVRHYSSAPVTTQKKQFYRKMNANFLNCECISEGTENVKNCAIPLVFSASKALSLSTSRALNLPNKEKLWYLATPVFWQMRMPIKMQTHYQRNLIYHNNFKASILIISLSCTQFARINHQIYIFCILRIMFHVQASLRNICQGMQTRTR